MAARIEQFDNEADWLEARRRGVGSSEVPKLVFGSGHKQYLEKTTGESFFSGDSTLAEFGHRSEDLNAKWFCDVTGKQCEDPGDFCLMWHESAPLFATVDRLIVGEDAVLELKAAFGDLAYLVEKMKTEDLRHSKLESYLWQIMSQLACTGRSVGYLSIIYFTGYSCGHRWFRCKRDERFIRAIEKRVKEFWQCVETRTPPDWTAATAADMEAIRKSHLPTEGRAVELEGKDEMEFFAALEAADAKRSKANKEFDELKAKAIARMKQEGAERLICGSKQVPYTNKRWGGIKEYRDEQ